MTDFELARRMMVDSQVRPSDVTDLPLLSALSEVPREAFVPAARRPLAYMDEDLLIKEVDGIRRYMMEPAPFAKLVQLAEIRPTDLVLDVGCASGYSAAILAKLAESVVALESDADLVEAANATLVDLGIGNAAVVAGDLDRGFPGEGPYDVIVLEGSVDFVPEPILAQMKDGGRLVAVIGSGRTGKATLFRRVDDEVAANPAFDCAVQALPGFRNAPAFTF